MYSTFDQVYQRISHHGYLTTEWTELTQEIPFHYFKQGLITHLNTLNTAQMLIKLKHKQKQRVQLINFFQI